MITTVAIGLLYVLCFFLMLLCLGILRRLLAIEKHLGMSVVRVVDLGGVSTGRSKGEIG